MPVTSTNRPLAIAAFLDQAGWAEAQTQALDGDFSPRRYARLTKTENERAILMDADADQNTAQFAGIAKILRRLGIEAPEIYAAAPEQGLLLLQDFGARNAGALIDAGENPETFLLRAADILARLHRGFDQADASGLGLPLFNTALFTAQAELFLDAYFPYAKQRDAAEEERRDFRAAWHAVLRPIETMPKSLLLRDFMPDNLMDISKISPPLAGRRGTATTHPRQLSLRGEGGVPPESPLTLGVLDFQDAGIGPVAYDLASLCEEVRRDGAFALLPAIVARYREQSQTPLSQTDLMRACTILSAQRHTRILGIVTQRALKTGRGDKLDYIPRIRRHLSGILAEPYLGPIREWVGRFMGDKQ